MFWITFYMYIIYLQTKYYTKRPNVVVHTSLTVHSLNSEPSGMYGMQTYKINKWAS